MLISHRKKFIFTKTAKTAGTSTEVYFEPCCLPEGTWQFTHARETFVGITGIIGYRGADASHQMWYNHMSAALIRQLIGHDKWSAYYKFCTVRSPFAKLVSAFHFFERTQPQASTSISAISAPHEPLNTGAPKEQFCAWVQQGGLPDDSDKYKIDGKLCLDYFIKQEDLVAGIKHVCEVLDIPFQPDRIPRLKAESRPKQFLLKNYYDAETIALVVKKYAFEFEAFDYPTTLET